MSIKTSWRPDGTLEITCGNETILVPPRPSGTSSGPIDSGGFVDELYGRGAISFGLVIGDPPGRGSLGNLPFQSSASSIAIESASDMVKYIRQGKVDFTWQSTKPFHVHDVTKRLGSDFGHSVAINIRPSKKIL
jgi:hypothetical protein